MIFPNCLAEEHSLLRAWCDRPTFASEVQLSVQLHLRRVNVDLHPHLTFIVNLEDSEDHVDFPSVCAVVDIDHLPSYQYIGSRRSSTDTLTLWYCHLLMKNGLLECPVVVLTSR